MKKFLSLILVFTLLVFTLASCYQEETLNYAQAIEKMNAYTSEIKGKVVEHKADSSWVGGDSSIDELPPIDKYKLSVTGTNQINIEIFSSTEKSNASTDSWMEVQGKAFNDQNLKVGNKTVSVSIRPIASGLALNYITKRTHIPDAYTPANELWGEMISSVGIPIKLIEKKLTGNVAGILMKKATYDKFVKKYSSVNIDNVVKAVLAGDIILGHTNPNVSSTGLNIFTQELRSLDSKNPFSIASLTKYREFQSLTPPTSPTTKEMGKVAAKGIMDAMIMESQAYLAEPTLSDWVFTPAGVRHDSPVYAMNNLVADKMEVLKLFIDFCKTAEAQKSATSFGFNTQNNYAGVENKYTGAQLYEALKVWKENKDGGKPIISVFIVDRSGSMAGNKLKRVKDALKNSLQYINPSNQIGLISFSSPNDISIDLPIAEFNPKQQSYFAGAVNDFEAAGGTATNDALVVALDMVIKAKALTPNAKIRILVLSDGQQLNGLSLGDVIGLVNGIGIPVYGVGFEADLADLQKLADINEGYCINADSQDVVYKLRDLFVAEL